jgi:hypothetical protein
MNVGSAINEVARLVSTEEDKRQACQHMLGLLVGQTDVQTATALAWGITLLDGTTEDKRQAREALLGLLVGQADRQLAARLVGEIVNLGPTAGEVTAWRTWGCPPTTAFLAAVRRNTTPTVWLATIPALTSLTSPPP